MCHRNLGNPHIRDAHVHTDAHFRYRALHLGRWPRGTRNCDGISRIYDNKRPYVIQSECDPDMAQRDIFLHPAVHLRRLSSRMRWCLSQIWRVSPHSHTTDIINSNRHIPWLTESSCYDACTSHSISSPECTLPSATLTTPDPVTLAGASTTGTISKFNITAPAIGLYEAPVREEKAWCLGASFMCRPKGWGRRRG